MSEDVEALIVLIENKGMEDDGDEDTEVEVYDAPENHLPHMLNRNYGEPLRLSLANYLGFQRGVPLSD